MTHLARFRALAAAAALALAAAAPATAWAAGAAGVPSILDGLGVDRLAGGIVGLLSIQLLIGFALGVVAGEIGRHAWKAGLGAFKSLLTFGRFAGQYGVVAVLLGAILYFV